MRAPITAGPPGEIETPPNGKGPNEGGEDKAASEVGRDSGSSQLVSVPAVRRPFAQNAISRTRWVNGAGRVTVLATARGLIARPPFDFAGIRIALARVAAVVGRFPI